MWNNLSEYPSCSEIIKECLQLWTRRCTSHSNIHAVMVCSLHLDSLVISRNILFGIWLISPLQQWVPHLFMCSTRRWCFLFYTFANSSVLWVWRNTSGYLPVTYFYHIFWCLPPFSLDIITATWAPPAWGALPLGAFLSAAKGHMYLS